MQHQHKRINKRLTCQKVEVDRIGSINSQPILTDPFMLKRFVSQVCFPVPIILLSYHPFNILFRPARSRRD